MTAARNRPTTPVWPGHADTPGYWDSRAARRGLAAVMWPNRAFNERVDRLEKQALVEWLGDVGGKRILDIGCGMGRLSFFLADRGAAVTGIDFSEAMIASAEAENRRRPPDRRVRLLRGALEELHGQLGRFDCLVSVAALCFSDEARFRERVGIACGLLEDGGSAFLIEPIHRWRPLRRVCPLPLAGWIAEFRRSGLSLVARRGMVALFCKFLCSILPVPDRVVRALFALGERVLRVPGADRVLADYQCLLFRKAAR